MGEYSRAVEKALVGLIIVKAGVDYLHETYEECPELNNLIDVQRVVPMSIDEWAAELDVVLEEVEAKLLLLHSVGS